MIVASKIIEDRPQIDGRRSVRERHVDDSGNEFFVDCMVEKTVDVLASLTSRAMQLSEAQVAQKSLEESARITERSRATALLSLPDEQLAAILKIETVDLDSEKQRLRQVM